MECEEIVADEMWSVIFGKLWEQAKVTARLVITYFNWLWRHSRTRDTAFNGLDRLTSLGYGTILLPIPCFSDAQPKFSIAVSIALCAPTLTKDA